MDTSVGNSSQVHYLYLAIQKQRCWVESTIFPHITLARCQTYLFSFFQFWRKNTYNPGKYCIRNEGIFSHEKCLIWGGQLAFEHKMKETSFNIVKRCKQQNNGCNNDSERQLNLLTALSQNLPDWNCSLSSNITSMNYLIWRKNL